MQSSERRGRSLQPLSLLISPLVAAKAGFARMAFGSLLLIVTTQGPNAIKTTAHGVSDSAILPVWPAGAL
jgi:hypothetical protein